MNFSRMICEGSLVPLWYSSVLKPASSLQRNLKQDLLSALDESEVLLKNKYGHVDVVSICTQGNMLD